MIMEIVVCIKRVPDTAEIDIEITPAGRGIKSDDLVFGISEWDKFAVEEAIRIREAVGGRITAITVGDEDSEDVLRRALAMGADDALRIEPENFDQTDAYSIARLLCTAIEGRPFDLILTGAVSGDLGAGMVGGMVAAMLDIPQVALATRIGVSGTTVQVQHEVENGLERIVEVSLPALVTVQTGINEPRYVSIRGIRKVSQIEIPVVKPGVATEEAWATVDELHLPIVEHRAEILKGNTEDLVDQLIQRLKVRGGL
ncbi:electron transfer flavoprotein subunit beta/FixA family protein [Bacteroidota bacterium]